MQLTAQEIEFFLSLSLKPVDVIGGPQDGYVYWVNPNAYGNKEFTANMGDEENPSLYGYDEIMDVMLYIDKGETEC